MSDLFSDQETVDRYNQPTLEHLIGQNKMKDLALTKATNLIQLLNIQLEVERNSNQENIRFIEQDLKQQYEVEIARFKEKIEVLQREINRNNSHSKSNQKTLRQPSFLRANSLRSFESKKKRSINKKYTQNNTQKSAEKQDNQPPIISIKNQVFRIRMLQMQQFKVSVLEQLDRMVTTQYEELGGLINAIEAYSDDFESMVAQRPKQSRDLVSQMSKIIKDQHNLINSLRIYSQQLQDLYKGNNYKMQSFLQRDKDIFIDWDQQIHFDPLVRQMVLTLRRKKQQWDRGYRSLQDQNIELRQILDSMIKLVRQEKKTRH